MAHIIFCISDPLLVFSASPETRMFDFGGENVVLKGETLRRLQSSAHRGRHRPAEGPRVAASKHQRNNFLFALSFNICGVVVFSFIYFLNFTCNNGVTGKKGLLNE